MIPASRHRLPWSMTAAVVGLGMLATACAWLDLGGENNVCSPSLTWAEYPNGIQDPGGRLVGVSAIRLLITVDVNEVVAGSPFASTILAESSLSIQLLVTSRAGAEHFEQLVESVVIEGGGRIPTATLVPTLPMALADCTIGADCHREFTVTIQFADRFVHNDSSFKWIPSIGLWQDDGIGTYPECVGDLGAGIVVRSTVLEIVPGVPGGGVVGWGMDGGVRFDGGTPDGGMPSGD